MFAWVGQVRAIWDLSGKLVELQERLETLNTVQGELRADLTRIDERTRKQVYRATVAQENAGAQVNGAVPGVDKQAILRAARALGMPT